MHWGQTCMIDVTLLQNIMQRIGGLANGASPFCFMCWAARMVLVKLRGAP